MKRTEIKRKAPLQPKRRPRKCRVCHQPYMPRSTTQRACSPQCALELAGREREKRQAANEKAKRARTREAKERLKTRSDHMREAQAVFNAWVRERDHGRPCISCDSTPSNAGLITGSRGMPATTDPWAPARNCDSSH